MKYQYVAIHEGYFWRHPSKRHKDEYNAKYGVYGATNLLLRRGKLAAMWEKHGKPICVFVWGDEDIKGTFFQLDPLNPTKMKESDFVTEDIKHLVKIKNKEKSDIEDLVNKYLVVNVGPQKQVSETWSDGELLAVNKAYFKMLNQQLNGEMVRLAEMVQNLCKTDLKNRDKDAVKLKMQNVSDVLLQFSHPIINGLEPKIDGGPTILGRIKKIVIENHLIQTSQYTPTADPLELERKVDALIEIGIDECPKGQDAPKKMSNARDEYVRDPQVKAYVINMAKGVCELCNSKGPFLNKHGQPFLEAHHVTSLSEKGKDNPTNVVALCPNCHRECHYSIEKDNVRSKIIGKVERIKALAK